MDISREDQKLIDNLSDELFSKLMEFLEEFYKYNIKQLNDKDSHVITAIQTAVSKLHLTNSLNIIYLSTEKDNKVKEKVFNLIIAFYENDKKLIIDYKNKFMANNI